MKMKKKRHDHTINQKGKFIECRVTRIQKEK